jgi:hypothetical protein
LELRDRYSSLEFGVLNSNISADIRKAMDWLWMYKGKLLIISTKFYEGVHYAQLPRHFSIIIDHLEQLHSQGYVHGDIRAYNMVLQYNASGSESDDDVDGWLIDFDYGGKNGEVEYPKGYKDELHDGRRPGQEGEKITIMDDWQSLIGLIFHTHIFKKKQGAELTDTQKLSILENEKELQDCRHMEVEQIVLLLREYIAITSNVCYVTLHTNYESDLRKCGLLETRKEFNASQAATGSPPKG